VEFVAITKTAESVVQIAEGEEGENVIEAVPIPVVVIEYVPPEIVPGHCGLPVRLVFSNWTCSV